MTGWDLIMECEDKLLPKKTMTKTEQKYYKPLSVGTGKKSKGGRKGKCSTVCILA